MIEFIVILAVLLFIAVLFYKQANEQFEIIQIEADRLQELPTLYHDRSPIVVSDFSTPNLGTEEELKKRQHIMRMMVTSTTNLAGLLSNKQFLAHFTFPMKTAEFLAKETGLHIWFEHHLYKSLLPSSYTSFLYSFQTSLWPQKRGMFKTKAFQTLLMVTQGTAIVTIMLPKMIPYLPAKWNSRAFTSLSMQDTPLLNQIQFIEIKLRKSNLLLLPAHLIVDIRSSTSEKEVDAWTFMAELHHPISRLA
jgi:hypothetical protein